MKEKLIYKLYRDFLEEYNKNDHKFYRFTKLGKQFWKQCPNGTGLDKMLFFYAGYFIAKNAYKIGD